MYDEGGNIKKEFFEQVVHRAYPENHSVWDKLQCSSSLTLKEFVQWFEEKHSLKLLNWNFIYGYIAYQPNSISLFGKNAKERGRFHLNQNWRK
jgi:hypothetical protein